MIIAKIGITVLVFFEDSEETLLHLYEAHNWNGLPVCSCFFACFSRFTCTLLLLLQDGL